MASESSGLFLSKDIIRRDLPSLRILTLRGVFMGANFPPLPSLTQLDIAPPFPKFCPAIMLLLLRCLQKTPNVEFVSIQGLVSDPTTQHLTRVALPKLSRLNISTPHVSGSTIFDYLQYPTSTSIHFTTYGGTFENADLASPKRAISRFAFRGTVSVIDVRINLTNNREIEVIIDTSRPSVPVNQRFKVKFPFVNRFPFMVDTIIKLCAPLPLDEAPSLTLTGFYFEGVNAELLQLFQPFKGVKSLCMRRCNEAMLQGLLGRDGEELLPLPKLRQILFDNCGHGDEAWPRDNMWRVMKDILSERKALGISLLLYWGGIRITETAGDSCTLDTLDGDAVCSGDEAEDHVALIYILLTETMHQSWIVELPEGGDPEFEILPRHPLILVPYSLIV